MGKDRAERVSSAPRGLGLYRRRGREGFFFVKNLAAQAKKHPGQIERAYIDEQIRRLDGSVVTSQREAETYCHRRNAEINEMLLALSGQTIQYSGTELESIAENLASRWITNWQRGVNLQDMDLENIGALATVLSAEGAERCDEEVTVHVSPEISINTTRAQAEMLERQLAAATPGERIDFKVFDPGQTRAEQQRLERLCWQQGFRPTKQDLQRLLARFAVLVSSHMAEAGKQQKRGAVEPPKPSLKKKGITWQQVLKAKENEVIATSTSKGIHNAVKRLQDFSKAQFGASLPSEIDTLMALAYQNWLFGPESPIRISSAGKEIRFINSALTAAVKQQLLLTNPFSALPKDRRSSHLSKAFARKDVDKNKVLTQEKAAEIIEAVKSDQSFDVLFLQAVTGARIQEIAGVRKCDFTDRRVGGESIKCIEIRQWEGRGHSLMGQGGGIKTQHSERVIPLPEIAHKVWAKYTDEDSGAPAFPQEKPGANGIWGDKLRARFARKFPGVGTHCWRETLVNNHQGVIDSRITEMITGKASRSVLSDYTSDDLPKMRDAIEVHVQKLGIAA